MSGSGMSAKDIVMAANRLIVAKRGLEAVETYFALDYVEHHHAIPAGDRAGLIASLKEMGFTEDAPNDRVLDLRIDHVIAEGGLVLVHQHIEEPGQPATVFMDLFRVAGGKIVEHWDVVQTVPETAANSRVAMY